MYFIYKLGENIIETGQEVAILRFDGGEMSKYSKIDSFGFYI